jgi:signal transduction histidine kinase
VLVANAAARRLTVEPPVRGTGLCDLLALYRPDDEGGGALDAAQVVPADPSGPSAHVRGRRVVSKTPPGSVWLLADAELLPAMHDRPPAVVLSLRDVTELVRKEEELRSALHIRDEFLSVASHELRTPITTLNLHVDAALKALASSPGGADDERLHRRLSSIRGQMTRLEHLVDALLDVSRFMEGRLQLQPEEADVVGIATDAVESLRESAARAGSTINLRCPATLVGRWDRLRIGQVVTNLLSNAIKFGRGRPIDVEVEPEEEQEQEPGQEQKEKQKQRQRQKQKDDGTWVLLRVRDGGIGILSEQQTRIFERFERGTSERYYPGLGLGLWIAKQIVDACHGSITVESQVDVGSTFIVRLPRAS